MEFDSCAVSNSTWRDSWGYHQSNRVTAALFDTIAEKWEKAGYRLPRLIFWNVNSRTGTIPVTQNEMGVALVSGFSPNVAKMVMSGSLDPMEALMDTLASERYKPVAQALLS